MKRSFLKEAFESGGLEADIQEGLNHYVDLFQNIINGTSVTDGPLIIVVMKILTLTIEQTMDADEKRMVHHLINQCTCFDINKMGDVK